MSREIEPWEDEHALVLAGDLVAERDRYREAILAHRATWQRSNGTNPRSARPADLALWAVLLDPARRKETL